MYCTVGEVLEMIKDDMKNVIIGDEYIDCLLYTSDAADEL